MISSTVYNSEVILDQIAVILRQSYGYEVIMSKEGNVYVPVGATNEDACLQAVNDCDLFFGIIFPRYGSGITHTEFKEAVRLNKPRWFVAHEKIEFLRKLLEPLMYDNEKKRNTFKIPKSSVLDSIKVIDMYNDVRDSWVHPFSTVDEIMVFLEAQFSDMEKRRGEIKKLNKQEND